MNLTDFLGSSIDKVIDSIGNAADNIFTNEEERKLLQNELEEIRLNAKLQAVDKQIELEKEITSRWKIDSEHIITRAVRPATVLWSYFLLSLCLMGMLENLT